MELVKKNRSVTLLTPGDVADRLGIGVDTLSAWRCLKRYDLPWIRVGRLIRYRPEDVEAFLASRTVGGGRGA